jgi:peptide-methionine (S)-S-oxide reductase
MTLGRRRRILCCRVRQEDGRWPRRLNALLEVTTTTGRLQRLPPGATLASPFGGAFEEGARAAGAVACFVRFSKSTTTALSAASISPATEPTSTKKAVLAGGCFWGMQDMFRRLRGVVSTRVGYTGGDLPNPSYGNHQGHAEAIEIVFDPAVVSYPAILERFFQVHDPTTYEQQGSDFGPSYRSAIFYTDEQQKETALTTIAEIEASGLWPGPVVTEINPEEPFWQAEPEHQNYLQRHPRGLQLPLRSAELAAAVGAHIPETRDSRGAERLSRRCRR